MVQSFQHIYDLPKDVYKYIFRYLEAEEIFDLGSCSKTIKTAVIDEVQHPISTALQQIQTEKTFLYNITTVYGNNKESPIFKNIEQCSNTNCLCRKFKQLNNIVIIDPEHCTPCIKYWNKTVCPHCCLLGLELFNLDACKACSMLGKICGKCIRDLY